MSRAPYFSDDANVRAMELEHRPLWAAFLRAVSEAVPPGVRVMDFGCSRGGLLSVLEMGYQAIWKGVRPSLALGVDVDTAAMRQVLARAARSRPGFLLTTASPARFPEQFDLVLSHEVAYLLPDLATVLGELRGALAEGGACCVATGCHGENPLYDRWRRVLEASGVETFAYRESDYDAALRAAGFRRIGRTRLKLSGAEYDRWVASREKSAPHPDWFSGAAEERWYYTDFGKTVLVGWRS